MEILSYYFASAIIIVFSFFNKKFAVGAFFLIAIVSLYNLMPTGRDYQYYEADYMSGFFTQSFPFFYTAAGLTAEPFYKFYTAFIRVLTGAGFQFFLVINFCICLFIYCISQPFKKSSSWMVLTSILFLIPVIFPTIFYFSPRSSISFFLVISSFYSVYRGRLFLSLILAFTGVGIHSQYIPYVFFMYFSYFSCYRVDLSLRKNIRRLLLVGGGFLVFLLLVPYLINTLANVLSFLPSGDVASTKLHYFSSSEKGFRATSVLSIVIYPLLNYLLLVNIDKVKNYLLSSIDNCDLLLYLITVTTIFGFTVNIAFFDTPHLSGRIARFSDYFLFITLIPLAIRCYFSGKVVLSVLSAFVFLSPVIFPTIYNVHGG